MGLQAEDIELVHRVVGTKHVFTSPQVPELHVSHADRQTAFDCIQPALDAIAEVKARLDHGGAPRHQPGRRAFG
jgi:hypothetical protein